MHTLTDQDIKRNPLVPFEGALRGESTLVLVDGHAVMLTLPLGARASTAVTLLELAAQLYDKQEISLGRAAEIAGVAYSEMMDELGRRGIATLRLQAGDLEREVAAFGP
jgi:predicted HTH domain antitoxin